MSLPGYLQQASRQYKQEKLAGLRARSSRTSAIACNPDDPVTWIVEHFRIPETEDRRLQLHPYQEACLYEALRRGDEGKFVYSVVLWSDIKKSIKSTLAAAVVLWRAYHTEWGQFLIVANDLKQADSRVGYYLRRAIELNPAMRAEVKIRNYRVELPNHTIVEAIPIDPTGEAGGNADMVVFSELWGAHETAQKRMWTETTLPPQKFGHSQRWIETYAGFQGESELLENLYHAGVKEGRPLAPPGAPDGLEVWANDTARQFTLWNTQPRLDWQTPEYYAQEAAVLLPEEFQRVHRNQWGSSTEKFVDIAWWDACKGEVKPLARTHSVVLALDAGVSNDCFALVAVYREGSRVFVPFCRVWYPPKGGKILFSNPLDWDDPSTPEGEVRRLIRICNLLSIVYDPTQLHEMMTRLSMEFTVPCHEFNQGADRLEADKALYDRIQQRSITHNGDPDLREHVQNANRKADGDKLRIVKRADPLKIDAAVALSMGAEEITRFS